MIIEGEFFCGDHLRWNLGWPTPNYAGAYLVTLLAFAFVFSGSRWRWVALAVEIGGLFLLAKTCSRGAVVAWGLAWLFGMAASSGWRDTMQRLVWAGRAGAFAAIMLAVGFDWSRAPDDSAVPRDPGASASDGPAGRGAAPQDGSIVNRLALWQGGLQMIAVAPMAGWSAGESGRAYMNWFQDPERSEGFTTMVNSYLHVAVERGLPGLAGVLWAAAWLILLAWRGARDESPAGCGALGITRPTLIMAVGASLVGWLVANVFTTLWVDPKLWLVPAVAAILLGWATRLGRREVARAALWAVGPALLLPAILYGAGYWLVRSQSVWVVPGESGTVWAGNPKARDVWHVWPDAAILGPTPGKELRRWLAMEGDRLRFVVHRPDDDQSTGAVAPVDGAVLFGLQAARLAELSRITRRLIIIHPLTPPPDFEIRPGVVTLHLSGVDEMGGHPAWWDWMKGQKGKVIESRGCGADIRAIWPVAMRRELESEPIINAPQR